MKKEILDLIESNEGKFVLNNISYLRRYQTGKVIWNEGYMKGVDKIDD